MTFENSFDLNLSNFIAKYAKTFFYNAFLTDVEISLEDMKKFQDKIKSTNDLIADKFAEKIHAKTNLWVILSQNFFKFI